MSDEEDDEVVKEIPVYLSHSLSERLYLLQYPVLPALNSFQSSQVLKSRIKPENQEIVLEIGIDTNSPNYDRSHGEQIAQTVDRDKASREKIYGSKYMDRIVLESNKVLVDTDTLALGKMQGDEFHITPVKGVLSLVPTLPNYGSSKNDDEDEVVEAKPVSVRFARPEDKFKKPRGSTFTDLSMKSAQEAWTNTQFVDSESTLAQLERTRIFEEKESSSTRVPVLNTGGYLEELAPKEDPTINMASANTQDSSLSLTKLRKLPLEQRVLAVLKEVHVMATRDLIWICDESPGPILSTLQQVGVLVQGNWVLRSDVIFPKNTFSEHSGVPAETMAKARDYILHQLNQANTLERKNLSTLVKIPNEELKDIMCQVASLKRNRQWVFKLPLDSDFINKHPDIVEFQTRTWNAKWDQLKESFSFTTPSGKGSGRKKSSDESSVTSTTGSRRRKTSSMSESEESGAETSSKPAGRGSKGRRRNSSQSGSAPLTNGELKHGPTKPVHPVS